MAYREVDMWEILEVLRRLHREGAVWRAVWMESRLDTHPKPLWTPTPPRSHRPGRPPPPFTPPCTRPVRRLAVSRGVNFLHQ